MFNGAALVERTLTYDVSRHRAYAEVEGAATTVCLCVVYLNGVRAVTGTDFLCVLTLMNED